MSKTLCKSKQARKQAKQHLAGASEGLCYLCKKCGRAAMSKKRLCKPTKSELSAVA